MTIPALTPDALAALDPQSRRYWRDAGYEGAWARLGDRAVARYHARPCGRTVRLLEYCGVREARARAATREHLLGGGS